jgi:hypothetical protein
MWYLSRSSSWRSSFADIADIADREAAMSADALTEIGSDSIMTRATAARLRWVADLGVKDHFNGVVEGGTERRLIML